MSDGSQYYVYLCAAVAQSARNTSSAATGKHPKKRITNKEEVDARADTKRNLVQAMLTRPMPSGTGCIGEQSESLVTLVSPTEEQQRHFDDQGFLLLQSLLPAATVSLLNHRLEAVLAGEYDTGIPPDRMPNKPALGKLKNKSKRTLQVVNVSHADAAFARVVHSPELAALVAKLGGSSFAKGARVANDQVWAKPPGAGGLVFHRDSGAAVLLTVVYIPAAGAAARTSADTWAARFINRPPARPCCCCCPPLLCPYPDWLLQMATSVVN